MKNNDNHHELILRLQQSVKQEEIKYCCEMFCQDNKFDHYLLFGSIFTRLLSPPSYIISNLGKKVLHKKYPLEKITEACINSTTPIISGSFPKDSIMGNNLVQNTEFSTKKGLTISFPVHFPIGKFAFLHLSANTNKADSEEKIFSTLAAGNLFAKQAGMAILRLLESELENKPPYLNNREKECLLLATDGSTPQQTGEKMGLSHHTVIFHLKKAREKLATKNIPGAVSKAILQGEIKTIIGSEHD